MTDAAAVILLFTAGLLIGSFLNVCIYRLPRRESVVWPASRCTSCGRAIAWFENVPIVSWLLLRGRCRSCGAAISPIYPTIELATGLLFVAAYAAYGWTPLLAVRLLFVCAMIVLFAIDAIHQILPNVITVPGIVVGFLCSLALHPGWMSSLIGLLVGGLFPFIVAEAYVRIRGKEGMGMGDLKMLAMVGAFLGWPLVWITLMIACVLGIAIGGTALLVSRRGFATRIPFGTFIAVAALTCAFWEESVVQGYEGLVSSYLRWAGLA